MPCRVFQTAAAAGGTVKALRIPNGKRLSNARLKAKGDVAGLAPLWTVYGCVSLAWKG